jgi:hypothetical protein
MHWKNFVHGLPTLAFHRINSDFVGNYQLMEADSDRQDQNPQSSNNFRISKFKSYILQRSTFLKLKYENVIKRKNKPDPALVGGSYLFNEMKKSTPKSRETIPLI